MTTTRKLAIFQRESLDQYCLWSYFVFYVNRSGVYYVDFMGFSGYELPPLAFYKGWLYLFLLISTNTSFPMKNPPVSDRVTIIRYQEGVLQKLGEVPWLDGINISVPYLLLYEWPKGKRVLYKIDDSVELIAVGNERNLTLKSEPYESWLRKLPFDPDNLQNKQCLHPDQRRPQKPLKVFLYLYEKGRIEELPLFQVSEEGVRVLTPPIKYSRIVHKKWYQTQAGIFFMLFLVVLVFMLVTSLYKKRPRS